MDLFTSSLTPAEIVALPGFQEAVSLYLTPPAREPISSWHALDAYLARDVVGARTERVRILFLDKRNQLIADEVTGHGSVDHCPVYPREVAVRALELGACAVILTHNHPSGDPTPSQADIDITKRVRDALSVLGIAVHDHVVTGSGRVASFKALGLL